MRDTLVVVFVEKVGTVKNLLKKVLKKHYQIPRE
jgi:hypothetical protein